MRKKLLLVLSLTFLLTACQFKEKAVEKKEKKIQVLSTIAMIENLVSEVGKDHVISTTLIKGELDPHSYELVKGDDEKFARADVIFSNGLGLEHGYSLRRNLENNSKSFFLGDILIQNDPESLVIIDRQYDPHIWMDISLWTKMVDPIVAKLAELDPEHAAAFVQNASILKEKMLRADQEIYIQLQSISSEKRRLVTSHNAFNYFAKRYLRSPEEVHWQMRLSAPEGLAPEAELSARDLKRVIDYIKEHKINVLFAESNVNKEALKKIIATSYEKGMELRLSKKPLYVDSMGQNKSYLEMMKYNVGAIVEEIK